MTKHVESLLGPRLDEGSNPSTSTWRAGQIPANKSLNKTKPHNINLLCGFSCLKMTTQDRHRTEKRPHKTPIGGKLVAEISAIPNCHSIATRSLVTMFCAACYKTPTRKLTVKTGHFRTRQSLWILWLQWQWHILHLEPDFTYLKIASCMT